MDTCGLAFMARVTPSLIRKKVHVKGTKGGACVIMPSGHVSLMGFKDARDMHKCFARGLREARLSRNQVTMFPAIVNATFKLSEPLLAPVDMRAVAERLPDACYDPMNFPAVIIKDGKSTCTLFENGKLLVTGVKSREEGHRVLQRVVNNVLCMQAA
jgi:TATA-box binding protein (TBP) (component of TFIID and TFIIIB)